MPFTGRTRYDRRVSDDFLAHFLEGGVAHSLTQYARSARFPVDLQMRKNLKSGEEHATLYVGLTSVLNVVSKVRRGQEPRLALTAHATWTEASYGFEPSWREPAPASDWSERWPRVEDYLENVIRAVARTSHALVEGAVQSAVSGFADSTRVMLDREVVPHFLDKPTKQDVIEPLSRRLVEALHATRPVRGTPPPRFGAECDLLGLDDRGRLLAVEVKPHASTLVWTPAQATMYARVLQAWVDDDSDETPGWRAVVSGMLAQRQSLGLAESLDVDLSGPGRVVPVIAFQRGASARLVEGLWTVQQALLDAGVGDPDLEVYQVSLSGRLDRVQHGDLGTA